MIILDSGAVTFFARVPRTLAEYKRRLRGGVIVVPSAVLVECRTGDARRDTAVDRLIKRVSIDERLPKGLARKASAHGGTAGLRGGRARGRVRGSGRADHHR